MERLDKYEILEEIGRGAMGAVYKAFHPHLKKYIAIKEVRAELASDPEIQRRFEREAELLAQLPAHPNIVTVRDALQWEGRLYLVMDYIEGGTLSRLIEGGGVELARGAALLDQILSGLAAIHARGIVHRDLKPGNILLDQEGTAYISDFGIAQSKGQVAREATMLTARYAAPEAIDPSLKRGGADRQIDLYAAGMLACELLLGAARFRAAFPQIYNRSPDSAAQAWLDWHTDLRRKSPNLHEINPNIPKSFARVVERLMAKDVNERYRNADEARRDLAAGSGHPASHGYQMSSADDATVPLEELRRREPGRAPQTGSSLPPQPPAPRRRLPRLPAWATWGAGAAALLVLIAVAIYAMYSDPGFTITVTGAPSNAEVYVADVRRGIPVVVEAGDGSAAAAIKVYGVKMGSHTLRVDCQGGAAKLYTRDNQPLAGDVAGKDGDDIQIIAQCGAPESLPVEIDYKGKMRLVRAGDFLMGDAQGKPNEQPEHVVSLNYDYYIDKHEVTISAYQDFCRAKGRPFPAPPIWDPQFFESNPNGPMVGVSWSDADSYAQWTDKKLPTEAEWEKAASWDPKATGPDRKWKRRWPWGDSQSGSRANFGSRRPTPVGQDGGASAYQVFDLAGNVAEWTADFYQPYSGNQTPDTSYGSTHRVVRGGSFNSPTADDVRATRRFFRLPEFSDQDLSNKAWLIGFRCVVRANDSKLREHVRRTGQLTQSSQ